MNKLLVFFVVILGNSILSFSNLNLHAQSNSEKVKPELRSIHVENKEVFPNEDNLIIIKEGEAIRVSGRGTPEDNIKISIKDVSLENIIDKNGEWFFLFSMPKLDGKEYPLEAQINENEEKTVLTNIMNYKSRAAFDSKKDIFQSNNNPAKYLTVGIIFLLLLAFFIIYLKNRKN